MAEASFQDLQMAINGFDSALKDYAVQSAVTGATEQVKQLQSAQMDEMQKRNEMENLSRNLALQLTGAGANAAQVQTAFQAVAPTPFQNPGEMFGQALQKDSEPMKQKATEWRDFLSNPQFEMAKIRTAATAGMAAQKMSMKGQEQFSKLLPQVQDKYNKSIKVLQDKLGQIELVANLPKSSIRDRQELTTLVKSVGQDVGAIGDKEADATLSPAMASKFKALRNYITGAAQSVRTPEQAQEVLKTFNKSKEMIQSVINGRTKQYAYQLHKSAQRFGVDLTPEEAVSSLTTSDMSAFDAALGGGGGAQGAAQSEAQGAGGPSLDSFFRMK